MPPNSTNAAGVAERAAGPLQAVFASENMANVFGRDVQVDAVRNCPGAMQTLADFRRELSRHGISLNDAHVPETVRRTIVEKLGFTPRLFDWAFDMSRKLRYTPVTKEAPVNGSASNPPRPASSFTRDPTVGKAATGAKKAYQFTAVQLTALTPQERRAYDWVIAQDLDIRLPFRHTKQLAVGLGSTPQNACQLVSRLRKVASIPTPSLRKEDRVPQITTVPYAPPAAAPPAAPLVECGTKFEQELKAAVLEPDPEAQLAPTKPTAEFGMRTTADMLPDPQPFHEPAAAGPPRTLMAPLPPGQAFLVGVSVQVNDDQVIASQQTGAWQKPMAYDLWFAAREVTDPKLRLTALLRVARLLENS